MAMRFCGKPAAGNLAGVVVPEGPADAAFRVVRVAQAVRMDVAFQVARVDVVVRAGEEDPAAALTSGSTSITSLFWEVRRQAHRG